MKIKARITAWILVLALLLSSSLLGTLSVSASADTFKLGVEELYIAASPTSGVTTYQTIPVLTPDGQPYTEKLTWTTSDKTTVAISTSTSVPAGTFYGVYNTTGTEAVITATNEAGESHSCKVHVTFDGEVITAGDFESNGYTVSKWTTNIIKSGVGEVVEDPDDPSNRVLKLVAGKSSLYYYSLPVKVNQTYRITFDVKGGDGTSTYSPFYLNSSHVSNGGWRTFATSVNEWRHCSYTFTTTASANRNYIFAFASKHHSTGASSGGPVYFDNVSITAVGSAESIALNTEALAMEIGDTATLTATPAPEGATMNRVQWSSSNDNVATVDKDGKITAVAEGSAVITGTSNKLTATCTVTVYDELITALVDPDLQGGTLQTDAVIGKVQAGDVVTVTVNPDAGYVLVPGSLKYVKANGSEYPILNAEYPTDTTFGGTAGNTFQFEMPEEKVTVTAQFASAAEQNFQMQTVGTSVHYSGVDAEGNPAYDGVRFLTRLNLANKFDPSSDTLTVTYAGQEYEVVELGSLLKREENETELNYDNAVAKSTALGNEKMWISRAYTREDNIYRLVDYTDAYIDFVSVMMTGYIERFYTARGYALLEAEDGTRVTILCDELTNSISTVVRVLPDAETMAGVTGEKWSPYSNAHTVEPGERLTYTIDVNNPNGTAGTVTVFDPLPANTTYLGGADEVIAKNAVWTVEFAAGETKKSVAYTVKVDNDLELCEGGAVVAADAQVGEEIVPCDSTLYIERAVNTADARYVNNAILALEDSTWTDLMYVYQVFNVAYSNGFTGFRKDNVYSGYSAADVLDSIINGDGTVAYSYITESGSKTTGTNNHLDNVAPTLYGGTAVKGAIAGVKGEPAAAVHESDLMIGDVIIVKNSDVVTSYIYSAKGLNLIKTTGGTEAADIAVLDTLTTSQAYIVLRVRAGLKTTKSSDPYETPASESYTPEQAALINTAEAYLMRGQKVQYADTKFGYTGTTTYNGVLNEYRWRLREDAPEDCTVDYTKYINCSTFCFDSYYFGLGYRLFNKNESYTCAKMVENSASGKDNLRAFYYTRAVTDEHTAEEKQQVEEQFMSTIQPGDLLIILRANESSNHVMMYIGNGKMIHATGSTYRYNSNGKGAFDQAEAGIRYHQVWDYFFRETSSNYTFGAKLTTLCVVRPLKAYNGEIPENTINRMENLDGIVAQKLSSHRAANTVTAGDTVTYTFDLRNTNDEAKTVDITDTIPAQTTYVSGAQTVEGDTVKWTVTIPANSTVQASYTIRVNADAPNGTTLATVAKIGGVAFDCPAVTVGNTLNATAQDAIASALAAIKAEGTTLTDLELANAIYERAGLGTAFADTDLGVVTLGDKGVFQPMPNTTNTNYLLSTDTVYRQMLAPTMYGGNRLYTPLWDHDRSRLPAAADLVVGDILIQRASASSYYVYLYAGGDKLYSLTNAKDDTMTAEARMNAMLGRYSYGTASHYFAVLRPSLAAE